MLLQKQTIWFGYIKLAELSQIDLPVEASIGIARLLKVLEVAYQEVETQKLVLLKKYGEKDEQRRQWVVSPLSDKAMDLAIEFGTLLAQTYEKELPIEIVKLPLTKKSVCNNCHKEIETSFVISPSILKPLLGIFIEVDEC